MQLISHLVDTMYWRHQQVLSHRAQRHVFAATGLQQPRLDLGWYQSNALPGILGHHPEGADARRCGHPAGRWKWQHRQGGGASQRMPCSCTVVATTLALSAIMASQSFIILLGLPAQNGWPLPHWLLSGVASRAQETSPPKGRLLQQSNRDSSQDVMYIQRINLRQR